MRYIELIKNWLDRPFPLQEAGHNKYIHNFLFAAFIYLFLLIFQPFGISDIQHYKAVYLLGFFLITFIISLLSEWLLPLIFRTAFNPENWTIKKVLFLSLWHILSITFFNWLYNSTVGKDITEQHSLLDFLWITMTVGFFPSVFFVMYAERHLSSKHQRLAQKMTQRLHAPKEGKADRQALRIMGENNNDKLVIEPDHLICIRSEGNYAHVFYLEEESLKKRLIRNSLSNLFEQLNDHGEFKRCHRSYIVNLNKVEQVSGNARNYNLHINALEFTIPVSRNFPKSLIERIKD